jgi:predicted DNA-binding protein (MmcQ/YjbR family)
MDITDLQKLCKKLKATTEDIKWGHDLCFCIGEKMYLVAGLDEHPTSASFKVSDEEFEDMCQRDGFIPAPYMAKNKWVKVDDINRMSKKEWEYYATQAYDLVKTKLTKKLQKELGLD